jgi:peroxiredoxin
MRRLCFVSETEPKFEEKELALMTVVLLAIAVALLALILISLWAVLYQLIKQQGRLLLRQDEWERRLTHMLPGVALEQEVSTGSSDHNGSLVEPLGIKVGMFVASFALSDLNGKEVDLKDFRGQQVLLIQWNPLCRYCDLIAPDLAMLQSEFKKRGVQMLFVSDGDATDNQALAQKYGLEAPILLMGKNAPHLEAFESVGTPAAYFLEEKGKVARPLAVGADQVLELAREAARADGETRRRRLAGEKPLSESRIERGGLKAGTPIPAFTLPDVYGNTVSWEVFRGRETLLVFTDPHCGPCDALVAHLVRLHQEQDGKELAIVMVGRGEAEENRKKAERQGVRFPVILQRQWELSKQFGIFATPAAFLIDAEGIIAKNVAIGTDQILAVVEEALSGCRR